jgi:hypothetical protein
MSGLFAGELRLMRALGECTDLREARAVYFSRRESARASSPPLHVLMRCRISGERLMRMAEELFELAGLPLK